MEAAEHRLGPDRAGHRIVQERSATEYARRVNARVRRTSNRVEFSLRLGQRQVVALMVLTFS